MHSFDSEALFKSIIIQTKIITVKEKEFNSNQLFEFELAKIFVRTKCQEHCG